MSTKRGCKIRGVLIATAWLASCAFGAASEKEVFQFVQKNCSGCHNPSVKSGDVDLRSFRDAASFDKDREIWEKVAEKVKMGQMPPPGSPKPPVETAAAVTEFLHQEFARQDRMVKPDAGRVSARRLNRAEYNNTMRDLLGIDVQPADSFPADVAAFGFDNISDALTLTPTLLEKYMDAAEMAVRAAIFGPEQRKPAAVHYSAPVRINIARGQQQLPPNLFDYDLSGLSTPLSAHFIHRFPVDGEYSFRVVLNGHRPNQSEPVHPALFLDGKMLKEWEVDATDLEGQIVETRLKVSAGEHLISTSYLKAYHGLPPSYNGPEPSKRPAVPLISAKGKLSEEDIATLRKYGTKIKTDTIERRVDPRFESLDIGGPFFQERNPSVESTRLLFVCGVKRSEQTPACASKILNRFVSRAFRRPATKAELAQYLDIASLARKQGEPFNEQIATAMQAVLVSPKFLYRMEQDRAPDKERTSLPVSDYELASRLSYFLWSSMPDDTLLQAAAKNQLRNPTMLQAQVTRMLRDPKAGALVENFAGQWLQFKNIDVLRPDQEKFPLFDEGLRMAMRKETTLFLENLIRTDGSLLDLLDAKYTFLNERLARFYGVANVAGPEFRRVDMSNQPRGGGILAHASVLTVSSYSTRTSPVLRGKWILENILNAPPPPPPPGVPPLEEAKAGNGTLRQQMETHRTNPACASCHSRMDPLGFGLENYNAIGAWRTEDDKQPIDAKGTLPDGRSFSTPAELRKILLADKDAFVRGLSDKMLTFALGRGLERYDKPAIAQISAKALQGEARFSQLVMGIVNSLPFQMRRAKDGSPPAMAKAHTERRTQ